MSQPGSAPSYIPTPQQHQAAQHQREQHLDAARRLARRYRVCGLPAEDVQQEAAAAALEAALSFDHTRHADLADHVARTIRRRLRQLCRAEARQRHIPVPPDIVDRREDPIERADRADFWAHAKAALSPRRHACLRLYASGHPDRDIALDLDISVVLVRQERRRAIRQLQGI